MQLNWRENSLLSFRSKALIQKKDCSSWDLSGKKRKKNTIVFIIKRILTFNMIISYLIFFNRNNNCNETKYIYLNVYIISIKKLFLFNLINLVSINMCINLIIINLYTGRNIYKIRRDISSTTIVHIPHPYQCTKNN